MPLKTDDLVEIQQLYARYNTAIDTGQGEAFAECFVEEGHFDSGMSKLDGREAIAGFARQTHEALPDMRHNATNLVLEGDGDEARGSAFLIGYRAGSAFQVIATGRYQDELRRTGDGWRFTKRVFRAD